MTLANKITLVRIFMVPVFMVILFLKIKFGSIFAALVFILAASTDGLDGYFARKRGQITKVGKFLDPLADKLLISAALISLIEDPRIHLPAWVAMMIIGREFAVTGLRSIAAAEGVIISASKWGKLKTVFQIIAIASLLIFNGETLSKLFSIPLAFHHYFKIFNYSLVTLALLFTVFSGLDYLIKAQKLLDEA